MIKVEGLSRRYGKHLAVADLDFEVGRGEVVGFLGPNGAGKSTTMKILTGTLAPSAGKVQVAGHDLLDEPLAVRRKVGFMPEHTPLYPDMSVRGFLEFVADLKEVPGAEVAGHLSALIAFHRPEGCGRPPGGPPEPRLSQTRGAGAGPGGRSRGADPRRTRPAGSIRIRSWKSASSSRASRGSARFC